MQVEDGESDSGSSQGSSKTITVGTMDEVVEQLVSADGDDPYFAEEPVVKNDLADSQRTFMYN